jgi:transposase
LLVAARSALMLRDHYTNLTPHHRRRLRRLVGKSRGRPKNLSKAEREELRRIVSKLDLRRLAHNVAALASPLPWPRQKKG